MITIYDVAKEAGVSIATVSYALNDKTGVSEKARKRIKVIANDMGFIPNSLAQGLMSKKTNILGVVVADIQNLYTSTFIKHLEQFARNEDFYLLLGSTSNDFNTEVEIVERFISKNVDSLVILPGTCHQEEEYSRIVGDIRKRGIPFVILNAYFEGIAADYVLTDIEMGMYTITKYLIENGHKNILFAGGNRSGYHSRIKYSGFNRAMEQFNLTAGEDLYLEGSIDYTAKDGYDIINKYLESSRKPPDAIVAITDMVAQGVAKGLSERGLKIPEDISIVGNDDLGIPLMDFVPLTTMRSPVEEAAKRCIEVLKSSKLNNDIQKLYTLEQVLVERDSVKKKK